MMLLLLGPFSSGSQGGPGAFGYFVIGGLTCLAAWALLQEWQRTKEIRQYAQSKGFQYIGTCLPRSFPFGDASVYWASSIKNAVAGNRNRRELLFFDCRLGSGKGSRTQTVVAVRGPEGCFGPVRFGPFLKIEKVGEWTLVYRPRKRMPLEEIDALVAEI